MKRQRVIWIMMISMVSVLGFLLSCTIPLTDGIMNNSRALFYTIPAEPDPIGDSDSPLIVPLYAGKTTDVGTVMVWIDKETLFVEFSTTWLLTETHLDVVTHPSDFPQTKKGNPKPGQFAYKMTHDPGISTITYQIPMDDFDEAEILYFAAHGKVEEWTDGTLLNTESAWAGSYDFPGANWATYFAGEIHEPGNTYEDGSIFVEVSNFDEGNGHQPLMGLFVNGPEPPSIDNMVAMGGFDFVSGAGSCFLVPAGYPPGTELDPWIGTGGSIYDLYIWFDLNDNMNIVPYPEPGVDAMATIFPYVILIDGDVIITLIGGENGDIDSP